MHPLRVVSAGAARALIGRLTESREYDVPPVATMFGPVGAVDAAVRGDAGFDVVITSRVGLDALADLTEPGSGVEIGLVPTVLAIPAGGSLPAPASVDDVRRLLLAAGAVYCADLERSTAGRYVARLLEDLGLAAEVATHTYPEGAAALRALAEAAGTHTPTPGDPTNPVVHADPIPLALAQLTEILAAPGVRAVSATALPGPLGLRTRYVAAVGRSSARRAAAHRFVDVLTGADTAGLRADCGFDIAQ
jgi:molybdate transport system substrate-binding protein